MIGPQGNPGGMSSRMPKSDAVRAPEPAHLTGPGLITNSIRFFLGPFAWTADVPNAGNWQLPAMWLWYVILPAAIAGLFVGLQERPALRVVLITSLLFTAAFVVAGRGDSYRHREMIMPIFILGFALSVDVWRRYWRAFLVLYSVYLIGLAGLIASAAVQEGLSLREAQARISMFDVNGLLEPSRKDLFDFQKPYAHPQAPSRDFVATIESIKPTAIIGVSTVGKTFTRQVVEAMSRLNDRPIIFALSNPTEHAECTPEEAYQWSKGKALYAAGVQFPPVSYGGQTLLPGQANNLYIFPAVGMAIYATQTKRVTDEMFIEAAHALADQVTPGQLKQGLLYPPQSDILETEIKVAARVAKVVFDSNLARVAQPADCEAFIRSHVYKPEYRSLV